MKKIISVVSLALATFAASTAIAGDGNGKLTRLTSYGNAVIFAVENHPSPAPCAPGGTFAFDASTAQGKNMYAALLTAVASGKTISVFGSNSCPSYWGDAELPNSVTINP